MLQKRFAADIKRRFNFLKKMVRLFILERDALGIAPRRSLVFLAEVPTNPMPRQYEFLTDVQKIEAFNAWLQEQIAQGVMSVPAGTDPTRPWTAEVIESAYRRGIINSFFAAQTAQLGIAAGLTEEGVSSFVRAAFAQPETMSKVLLLATRSFEQLKGFTAQMSSQLNLILAKGMVDGSSITDIAEEMTSKIEGMTQQRAMLIARTEIIHAHAEGQLDAFKRLGVEELGVKAEWSTAGDDRVCPLCGANEGKIFTIDEARGLIPLHPNCRCTWIPYTADAEKAIGVQSNQ